MDINKVWISGLVVTSPTLTRVANKTPLTTFVIQINENFRDRKGVDRIKTNMIRIESLGKSAEATINRVKQGQRFQIDGYLRQDRNNDVDDVRVRSFAIYKEESEDTVRYNEGLQQAKRIIARSRDLKVALATIDEILAEDKRIIT